jgi:hypothetical protein
MANLADHKWSAEQTLGNTDVTGVNVADAWWIRSIKDKYEKYILISMIC